VEFKNYSARYRPELDLAVRNISFNVNKHEKVGVVGRTGAGKSTLTLALFRIIEAADGHIEIDGVDTSQIGLSDLRQKLSIIPQDSQIFTGTIRDNIDPFYEHDDTELWRVLDLCHLKSHVSEMDGGLDAQLADGGSNLSKGQTQLMCLARALLHESNVLLLDEATSSVDVETDAILQQTIRSEFKERTIITIAHRLNTIADSDRVIVLDHGEIKEFDTPGALLADENTIFSDLWRKGHGSSGTTSVIPKTKD
jgi:ABC-type multidrug transport system fused ATPase/permease subunit